MEICPGFSSFSVHLKRPWKFLLVTVDNSESNCESKLKILLSIRLTKKWACFWFLEVETSKIQKINALYLYVFIHQLLCNFEKRRRTPKQRGSLASPLPRKLWKSRQPACGVPLSHFNWICSLVSADVVPVRTKIAWHWRQNSLRSSSHGKVGDRRAKRVLCSPVILRKLRSAALGPRRGCNNHHSEFTWVKYRPRSGDHPGLSRYIFPWR